MPTAVPTAMPTVLPTKDPTLNPTIMPSKYPIVNNTETPIATNNEIITNNGSKSSKISNSIIKMIIICITIVLIIGLILLFMYKFGKIYIIEKHSKSQEIELNNLQSSVHASVMSTTQSPIQNAKTNTTFIARNLHQ